MQKEISNGKIASVLYQIADLLEIEGENLFKVLAYRKAAQAVESLPRPIAEIRMIEEIPGIGKGTAAVIQELLKSGESSFHKELLQRIPKDLLVLLRIPGLGPKGVGRLYKELGIDTLEKLEEAGKKQRIRALSGFGAKTELKILKGIKQMRERPDRIPIAFAYPIAHELKEKIERIHGVEKAAIAGSLRRFRETVKNINFIVSTADIEKVAKRLLDLPNITDVVLEESDHIIVEIHYLWPIHVDIRLVPPQSFAHALQQYTGSAEHITQLKERAYERNLQISEHGIISNGPGTERLEVLSSEEEIYRRLGLPYIPPEIREGRGEIARAGKEGVLPRLIRIEDIQGDLHMHSDWSDGGNSIEEMARAAYQRGYRYIAITDHSRSLRIAKGLSIERLLKQKEEIKRIEKKLRQQWQEDFRILSGVEMDILADGQLDYPEEILQEMDLVIGSIHSAFKQDEYNMTKRIIGAVLNNHVDFIAHPTGRLIGQRDPYAVNIEILIKAAKETGTALELNANPHRLDLKPEYLQQAIEAGVLITINTDAHSVDELANMEVGVGSARRGWVEPEHVINTWPIDQLIHYLKRND